MADVQIILERLRNDPCSDVDNLIVEYQLRPTLLDPVLPKCMELLASSYVNDPQPRILHSIYTLSRVRGYKLILQGFPTNVQLLEFLPQRLASVETDDWQSQYSLLLWLAAAILVPFDISTISSDLQSQLYSTGRFFLSKSGIQRDASSIFLARLLTRTISTQETQINNFLNKHLGSFFDEGENKEKFESLGVFQTLAHAMDRVSVVPQTVCALVDEAKRRADEEIELPFYGSTLVARLWLKVLGRTALRLPQQHGEFAVSECMALFDHESSQVRMSAAKYVAKVSKKLGPEAVQEVCDSIIGSLENEDVRHASTNYWNGALIALAEILRGAEAEDFSEVLQERLIEGVLELKALHFIQARLRTNIGANVRDAACYVCWSLFRSKARLVQRLRMVLYSSLVSLACLDNEVNIRRAAAAALQEGLGRYGSSAGDFPAQEMFHLIERINMHSVTSIGFCYTSIAPDFCGLSPAFARNFMLHGLNSGSPETRRISASAIPEMPETFVDEIAGLLLQSNPSGDQNEEDVSLHGKWLALGAICSKSPNHAPTQSVIESCRKLVKTELVGSSDLAAEAMLHLIAIEPHKIVGFLETLNSEDPHVIEAAEHLVARLPFEFLDREILPVASKRMSLSRLFVACLKEIASLHGWRSESLLPALLEAARLPDPLSRALAISALDYSREQSTMCIAEGLRDYSEDVRGDVGAWVREAAILRVSELGLPEDSAMAANMLESLWLMASESRQKTRLLAGNALLSLGQITEGLSEEDAAAYYLKLLEQCPSKESHFVCLGIASSIGAVRASVATIHGSLRGLLEYLKQPDSDWVIDGILSLKRASNSRAWEVVRTLKRLACSGYRFQFHQAGRTLAIVYNSSLNRQYPEALLLDAIDTLQILAMKGKVRARDRLAVLLKTNPNGNIRQRCADALFELGVEDDVLETTDWTSKQAFQQVGKLSF